MKSPVTMRRLGLAAAGLVALAVMSGAHRVEAGDELAAIEAKVRADYPGVSHMTLAEFEALRATGASVLLLDARETDEYVVSHLPGAHHVRPDLSAEAFGKRFGADLHGRTVVVYCSVGVRSSRFAARVAEVARTSGAAAVYNLEGGIFRWHNDGRPLARKDLATGEVHPYDRRWGSYIDNQDGVAYAPGGSKAGQSASD